MLNLTLIPESIEYHIPAIHSNLLMSFITWGILIASSLIVVHNAKLIPGKMQLIFESLFSYIFDLADQIIGHDARRYYPLFIGLFLFILVSNTIGLIPGLISPTSDPNTTFALAFTVFIYCNIEGIRRQGFSFFKQFLGPKMPWYMFPLSILLVITEVISSFTRPFSLGLRLFCNIFSKELFLQVLAILFIQFFLSSSLFDKVFSLGPFLLRPVIIILGIVIGLIQALVFTVLSITYVAGAVHAAEH
jgi:F-type H+-transporting ATPase subunit a